jgi:dipeptidyl aminopeptidase/acylaminoacyl peptidase
MLTYPKNVSGSLLLLMLMVPHFSPSQAPDVTPEDCVTARYVIGLWLNHKGTEIAYLLKTPDLVKNENNFQLYVKDVNDGSHNKGIILTTGEGISDIRWLEDDRRLVMLKSIAGKTQIVVVDSVSGHQDQSLISASPVVSYTIDASATTVVYSVLDSRMKPLPTLETKQDVAKGYRIDFGETPSDGYGTRTVYIRHRNKEGEWSVPTVLTIENPFNHKSAAHLEYARNLSLSPNGKRLFLTYLTDGIPKEWMENPDVKYTASINALLEVPILYNISTGQSTLGFRNIFSYSRPVWTSDSQSFFLVTHSPVGSRWESEDIRDHLISPKDVNLFEVNADSGEVSEVLRQVPAPAEHVGPLSLRQDGDVLVQTSYAVITRFHWSNDAWRGVDRIDLPGKEDDRFSLLAAAGSKVVGVHEAITESQNLFSYVPSQNRIQFLTDLNPQLRNRRFASVETIQWNTAEGLKIDGLLFMPRGYVIGQRYPLVIQTKGTYGTFVCDAGVDHSPSFAAQPIATSGMFYLIRLMGQHWRYQDDLDKRPKGYPGGISEAVQQTDIWDSAVDALSERGLIDSSKVGIIGFSRTGWQVEFDLVHGRTKYAAATAADNVEYSLGEYWLFPSSSLSDEQMYGGPPYGKSLESWERYSISFHLDSIHTPLLMEEMGNGVHESGEDLVPRDLAAHFEISRGLARLGKPFEMYYYPDEGHQPDHPLARLASVQRNLDWYRSWLQDYEDPDPAKRGQYQRWALLRQLQQRDLSPSDSAAEREPGQHK